MIRVDAPTNAHSQTTEADTKFVTAYSVHEGSKQNQK